MTTIELAMSVDAATRKCSAQPNGGHEEAAVDYNARYKILASYGPSGKSTSISLPLEDNRRAAMTWPRLLRLARGDESLVRRCIIRAGRRLTHADYRAKPTKTQGAVIVELACRLITGELPRRSPLERLSEETIAHWGRNNRV